MRRACRLTKSSAFSRSSRAHSGVSVPGQMTKASRENFWRNPSAGGSTSSADVCEMDAIPASLVSPGLLELESGLRQQRAHLWQRVFVTVLGMDALARHELERQPEVADADRRPPHLL